MTGGAFQSERELCEVVWRYDERAAKHARDFELHPDQVMADQPDGSLIVRFRAADWTGMAWHLYQWGDTVEVMAPQRSPPAKESAPSGGRAPPLSNFPTFIRF